MKFPTIIRIARRIWLQVGLFAVLMLAHVLLEFLPEVRQHPIYGKILSFLSVWILAWIVSRVLSVFRETSYVHEKLPPNLHLLVFTLARVFIYSLALLGALDTVGISITPLLASLGIGSLAIGLALQDTLGNLFSGFYLYVDRPISIGDWIRLESGIEGQVVGIGWRSTHLLVPQENVVVIPNSKLSSSILMNFNLPSRGSSLSVAIAVTYETDLDKAERTLVEAATRVASRMTDLFVDGGSPIVRYTKFGDSSIDLNLVVKLRSFPDQGEVRHELIKEIKLSFAQASIAIPYRKQIVQQMV